MERSGGWGSRERTGEIDGDDECRGSDVKMKSVISNTYKRGEMGKIVGKDAIGVGKKKSS